MVMHIDYAPIEDCKHPELTYGMICVKCDECGRFSTNRPHQSEIRVITQHYESIPPLWQYPREFGGHFVKKDDSGNSKWECWFRSDKLIKNGTTLEDIVSPYWYPDRLPYLRWWIEGRNY